MPGTQVILNGIVFVDWQVPQEITIGGKQANTVHKLLGGQRVVDAMGPDDNEITWTGRFRTDSALGQVAALDAMRIAGAAVPLTFCGLFYTVLISEFKAKIEKTHEVTYTITCIVVDDPATDSSDGSVPSLNDLVSGDMTSALGIVPAALAGPVQFLANAITALPSLVAAPISQMVPINVDVVNAQSSLTAGAAGYDAIIAASIGFGGVQAGYGTAPASALALPAQIAALQNEAATQAALAYVTRIGINIATAAI